MTDRGRILPAQCRSPWPFELEPATRTTAFNSLSVRIRDSDASDQKVRGAKLKVLFGLLGRILPKAVRVQFHGAEFEVHQHAQDLIVYPYVEKVVLRVQQI